MNAIASGVCAVGLVLSSGYLSAETLAEALDYYDGTVSSGGASSWYSQSSVSQYGGSAARSGTIGHGQSTYMQTTVYGPGTVSFYWRVSSEEDYDQLRFYIDGQEKDAISGEQGWYYVSYNFSSGTHVLKWEYSKDGSASSGSDCGWVDGVSVYYGDCDDCYDPYPEDEVVHGEDWLEVAGYDEMEAEVGYWDEFEAFTVDSGSAIKSVTVSGLPSGLKYNKATGLVEGRPTKRGVYYVTITAVNVNKYSHTLTQVWYVDSYDNGDYDNIGLEDAVDELEDLERLYVGDDVWVDCHDIKSVSGLPSGLKFSTRRGECWIDEDYGYAYCEMIKCISGRPTKAGKFKVTFTDYYGYKAVRTLVVRSHGSAYLSVTTQTASCCGFVAPGTVKGAGVVSVGSTVKLSASPRSGYYFAGWYWNDDEDEPLAEGDKDYRTASQSVVFTWKMANRMANGDFLCARFVTKAEDSEPYLDVESVWYVDTHASWDFLDLYPESLTLPKVTAKGLPAGVKLMSEGGDYWLEAQVSKLKPGTTVATLTLKNASGATSVRAVRIVVPNLESDFFEGLDYGDEAYVYHVGQALSGPCYVSPGLFSAAYGGFWTVSASGLPPGTKFVYRDGYGELDGVPTKAGTYTVTLTAKNGSRVEKATITVTIDPFPAQYVGTYNGVLGGSDEDTEESEGWEYYDNRGLVSMTVAANGKASVKVTRGGKTYSWSGYGFVGNDAFEIDCLESRDGYVMLSVYGDGRQNCLWGEVDLYPSCNFCSSDYYAVFGQKNVFAEDSFVKTKIARLNKLGKMIAYGCGSGVMTCPMCMYYTSTPATALTITVDTKGVAKAAGKIDGNAVSGTTTVMLTDGDDLYADFVFYSSRTGSIACRIYFEWDWVKDYSVNGMNAINYGYYEYIGN